MRPIYVRDIIDLYDYNRESDYPVWVSERDDNWNKLLSGSIALDLMSDMQVDSIGARGDVLCIYLHDNSVSEYWDKGQVETVPIETDY